MAKKRGRRPRPLTKRELTAKCLTEVNAALNAYYRQQNVYQHDLNKMLAMIVVLHTPMTMTVSLKAGEPVSA